MPKKVYLVRHGESEDGAHAVYQSDDTPLSATGIQQANVLAKRFSSIALDVVYTSPLPRAQQTATLIRPDLVQTVELLRELKRPSEIFGMPLHDPRALEIKTQIKAHMSEPDWHYADEENFHDVRKRSEVFLQKLEADPHEHILVVSHSMILRILGMLMIFGDMAGVEIYQVMYQKFRMTQTSITLFDYTPKGWLLMTWNDYAHLGEDTTEDFYRNRQDI